MSYNMLGKGVILLSGVDGVVFRVVRHSFVYLTLYSMGLCWIGLIFYHLGHLSEENDKDQETTSWLSI